MPMPRAQRLLLRADGPGAIGAIDVSGAEQALLTAGWAALLGISYYFAARLGLGFRFQNSQIGVVWPANGLFLAALLLTSRNKWWVVVLTTALAHVAVMNGRVPEWRWSWQIVGNTAFVMSTIYALRRFARLPLRFDSRRQVFAYTIIAFALPALYGFTTPAFVRSLFGYETFKPPSALLRTLLSNSTALLLVTPFVVLAAHRGIHSIRKLGNRRLLEALVMMAFLLGMGFVAFLTGPEIARFPSLLLWIVPPLLWGAVRFGPLGASATLFCVAALSIWGTAWRLGPFVLIMEDYQVLSLQLFWIVLSTMVLLLAAVIREREQVEEALHQQRNQLAHVTRVATAGELSVALAHELRQPLMSILANAEAGLQFLRSQQPDLAELRAILHDIAEQDRHAASVISHLRSFLKEGDSRFESLAIDSVVRDAMVLARSSIANSSVNMHTYIASGLPRVQGDPVQLLQVLLNLIVNACEAMTSKPIFDRRLLLKANATTDQHVEIVISDSGVGLPNGDANRVFEPFVTTKEKGLGLGLAIGRSIVQAHHGQLWAENNSQGGATFHILLPARAARAVHAH